MESLSCNRKKMEPIVVKTEVQNNGEILLFYVDENGGNEEGVITTVESIENQSLQLQNDTYVIQDVEGEVSNQTISRQSALGDHWTEEQTKRLLVFYNDNKQSFISGTTKKTHLWTVACKTMLIGKTPNLCEAQLISLQNKYNEIRRHIQKGVYVKWPYFELCHQIFQEETPVITVETLNTPKPQIIKFPAAKQNIDNNIMVVKKVNSRTTADEKVEMMLKLYIKYKDSFQQEHWRRGLWETIAMELGEDDGEYWQKRFLNYKQHYLRLLDKRRESGSGGINWPYMELFDQIFADDQDFHRKYLNEDYKLPENRVSIAEVPPAEDWNTAEMTVLVKYCFDCFDEFEDPTIPNNFLWTEIGRLLDKTAEACKAKYEELKSAHLDKYVEGGYDLRTRKPIAILFDNIISKEIEIEITQNSMKPESLDHWKTEELDELVQFFYENIEMYKDLVCHFVCWAGVAKKLNKDLQSCRGQWEDLLSLYKTVLNDKKENPDMQIDWRYIDVFDRIFDYGMDTKLLSGYETLKAQSGQFGQKDCSGKIGVKKVNIKSEDSIEEFSDDDESYDERGFTKHTKRRPGESKAFKILEYYQKNKDKFSTTKRNKHTLWEVLAKQLGISATQCAHRFRNLKQVYTAYVQREINKPEMPILWPYYALCKKVFGYRAIKTKLKYGKIESDDSEDWSAKEIKQLINYFSKNFNEINTDIDNLNNWTDLSTQIGKGMMSCKEKFIELRKSYRKLKTMRSRNPDVKISWKYFNMFEKIYTENENRMQELMEVDGNEQYLDLPNDSIEKMEQEEDDYQCIIVIPEGQDISQIENAQIIIEENPQILEEHALTSQEINTEEDASTPQEIKLGEHAPITQEINIEYTPAKQEIYTEDDVPIPQEMNLGEDEDAPITQEINIEEYTPSKQDINLEEQAPTTQEINLEEQAPTTQEIDIEEHTPTTQEINTEETEVKTDIKPLVKWTKRTKKRLIIFYINYIRLHKGKEINAREMWAEIARKLPDKTPLACRKMFAKLKANHKQIDEPDPNMKKTTYDTLMEKVMRLKPKFAKTEQNKALKDVKIYKDVALPDEKVEQALQYYLQNIEDFANPRFEKKYLWTELANTVSEPITKIFNKINYLKQSYNIETDEIAGEKTPFAGLLKEIFAKEIAINLVLENQPKPVIEEPGVDEIWSDEETEQLLEWYLSNLDKFKNPKFVRSYLWMEVSGLLNKSPITCSKKMSEIRTQYRNMVRERPDELNGWRFLDLCQKIYGTGKKGTPANISESVTDNNDILKIG